MGGGFRTTREFYQKKTCHALCFRGGNELLHHYYNNKPVIFNRSVDFLKNRLKNVTGKKQKTMRKLCKNAFRPKSIVRYYYYYSFVISKLVIETVIECVHGV